MKIQLLRHGLLPFLCLSSLLLFAAPLSVEQSGTIPAGMFVRVVQDVSGLPVLLVDYPWAQHDTPSIEVRTCAAGERDDPRQIQPIRFVDRFMKGEVTVDVYRCQDKGSILRSEKSFSVDKIDFHIIGDRNLLGAPAVCVACRTPSTVSGAETDKVSRAVFPLLDAWTTDSHTLMLKLPKDYFAAPAAIRVWLLRKGRIIWSERTVWPGEK